MAKFTMSANLSGHSILPLFYDQATMQVTSTSATEIVSTDTQGDYVRFTGTGLDGGSGIVTKVEFFNSDDEILTTVKGTFNAADLSTTDMFSTVTELQHGKDRIIGSNAADFMLYGQNIGNDRLLGRGGNDTLLASSGNNFYDGGKGKFDVLTFELANPASKMIEGVATGIKVDMVHGKIHNSWGGTDSVRNVEVIRGTEQKDTFTGGKHSETFAGYGGKDRFTGGLGKDHFEFGPGHGKDVFTDFGKGGDQLQLYGWDPVDTFAELKAMMEQHGKNVVIEFTPDDTLTFLHTRIADLHASQFDFLIFN